MANITILNISNVYTEETFYKHQDVKWIDCTEITGTDCYCDKDAANAIRDKIKNASEKGIHFIDSGNYHYISEFFIEKINYDFVLVVFDHHPDMQPSLFDGLLTCGSWVKDAIDTNKHLKKVILIGTSDKLLEKIDKRYLPNIVEFKESQLHDLDAWHNFSNEHLTLPVYISIDKDVLSPNTEVTNWDQGIATLPELKKLLAILLTHDKIIGIDICGECNYSIRGLLDENLQKDDIVNSELLNVCQKLNICG